MKYEIIISVHQAVIYGVEAESAEKARQFSIGDVGVEEVSRKTIEAQIIHVNEVNRV